MADDWRYAPAWEYIADMSKIDKESYDRAVEKSRQNTTAINGTLADVLKKENEELALLLLEWLNTPYFECKMEWQLWISDFRPRVKNALKKYGIDE